MIEKLPRGVSVRIEPGEPLAGGPYRQGQPEPGRLILEHRWDAPQPSPGLTAAISIAMAVPLLNVWLEPEPSGFGLVIHVLSFVVVVLLPIVMMHRALAVSGNTTTYTLDGVCLTVRHGPIPVLGNRAIATSDIATIDLRYIDDPDDESAIGTIVVFAQLRSAKEAKLVARGAKCEEYHFVVEQLSAHLNRMRDESGCIDD